MVKLYIKLNIDELIVKQLKRMNLQFLETFNSEEHPRNRSYNCTLMPKQ